MIDQEIRDALKVEPSPEFLARVRTRIASEPAPSAWRWSWTFAAAGAVAAAVIVAVIWSPIESRPGPSGPGSQVRASAGLAEARGRAEAEGPAVHARSVVSGLSRPSTRLRAALRLSKGRTVLAEPEILIDPREGVELQRLLEGITGGRVNLEPLARATAQRASALDDLHPPVEIVIPLLPLTPAPGEGERP